MWYELAASARNRQVADRQTEDASSINSQKLAIWRHRDLAMFTIFVLGYWREADKF